MLEEVSGLGLVSSSTGSSVSAKKDRTLGEYAKHIAFTAVTSLNPVRIELLRI